MYQISQYKEIACGSRNQKQLFPLLFYFSLLLLITIIALETMKLELKKLKEDNKKREMTLFLHQCLRARRLEPNDNMTATDWDVLL